MLTTRDVEQFVEDGFVRVGNAFPRTLPGGRAFPSRD
jgi:hypothetical protein